MTRLAAAFAMGMEAARSPGGVANLLASLADTSEQSSAMRLKAQLDAETARVKSRLRR